MLTKTKKMSGSQAIKMLEILLWQVLESAVFQSCLLVPFWRAGKYVKIQKFSRMESLS